jgi:hypothetical protein
MKATFHRGELKRYEVLCKSSDRLISDPGVRVLVFATGPEEAREAAVEKMKDKWYRHRSMITHWTAHDVVEC